MFQSFRHNACHLLFYSTFPWILCNRWVLMYYSFSFPPSDNSLTLKHGKRDKNLKQMNSGWCSGRGRRALCRSVITGDERVKTLRMFSLLTVPDLPLITVRTLSVFLCHLILLKTVPEKASLKTQEDRNKTRIFRISGGETKDCEILNMTRSRCNEVACFAFLGCKIYNWQDNTLAVFVSNYI